MSNIPWRAVTDFEKAIIAEEPEYDFIFGNVDAIPTCDPLVPRPKYHLEMVAKKNQHKAAKAELFHNNDNCEMLRVISEVQEIAGTKKLGEMPTLSDWDTYDDLERETIALMRHCGLKPSIDAPFIEEKIPKKPPLAEKMTIVKYGGGKFPIYFDESYFKFPTCEIDNFTTDNMPTTSSNIITPKEEHNDYVPVINTVNLPIEENYDHLPTTSNNMNKIKKGATKAAHDDKLPNISKNENTPKNKKNDIIPTKSTNNTKTKRKIKYKKMNF